MNKKKVSIPCRSCKAEIAFVITRKGNKMPVDVESLTDEDLELMEKGEPVPFRYNDHVSHFQTCPSAEEHRK